MKTGTIGTMKSSVSFTDNTGEQRRIESGERVRVIREEQVGLITFLTIASESGAVTRVQSFRVEIEPEPTVRERLDAAGERLDYTYALMQAAEREMWERGDCRHYDAMRALHMQADLAYSAALREWERVGN